MKMIEIVLNEDVHKYRTNFINNKTHENTYIIIYGRYDSHFEKSFKLEDNLLKFNTTIFF